MDPIAKILLAVSLVIIMIGMGLSLTLNDFKRVLKFPLAVFIGFLNQIILLPIIAYVLILLFKVESDIAIGVMILSACPGGPTSNLVTHLAKGDTALSVTLTAVNSVVTIITIPLIVNFAVSEFSADASTFDTPAGSILGILIAVIAVPLAIGMLIKAKKPAIALKLDKPVRIGSTLVIVLVIVGLVISEREHLVDYLSRSFAITFALNIVTMIIGFFTARLVKLNFKQSLTICLESGNQNGTLAIQVAGILNNSAYAIPAAVYSLFMYISASIPVAIGIKKNK